MRELTSNPGLNCARPPCSPSSPLTSTTGSASRTRRRRAPGCGRTPSRSLTTTTGSAGSRTEPPQRTASYWYAQSRANWSLSKNPSSRRLFFSRSEQWRRPRVVRLPLREHGGGRRGHTRAVREGGRRRMRMRLI